MITLIKQTFMYLASVTAICVAVVVLAAFAGAIQ